MNFIKNIFNPRTKKKLVFLVEDNIIYAKQVEQFLKSSYGNKLDVKHYPVFEVCEDELYLKPDMLIIDYHLDSKYYDAQNDLDVIKKIKHRNPSIQYVVLSNQTNVNLAVDSTKQKLCTYIAKDNSSFERLKNVIDSQLMNHQLYYS